MTPGLSITYATRIMKVMLQQDEITITNLAMLSRVNHQRCKLVVSTLHSAGYVAVKSRGKWEYFLLTNSGRIYGKNLLDIESANIGLESDILMQI